jgi:hypothetical protein
VLWLSLSCIHSVKSLFNTRDKKLRPRMRKQKDDFITFYEFKPISLFSFFFRDNSESVFIIFLVDSFDVLLLFFFFNQRCLPF